AEAVNTVCYVQNRVLIVKPHNKTPYEVFRGRTPALSFMRPFRCHVTILNTLDYLGKFDGKLDEGFFVGYSLNSDGPKWLFDIDVLTESMNYVPVVAGTNSNDLVSTKESIGAGHSSKETRFSQHTLHVQGDRRHAQGFSKGVEEPKKVIQVLKDPSWIEAMQEEHLQFKLQQVWTLVDLPHGKRAIGTKWVYKNKKDERGIVIKNKARLVAQRYTQEEGIDYDEVFAPVARIDRDIEMREIEEEVYVCQPPGFEDPEFPDRVYKKDDRIFISQDKYVDEILKKFGFLTVKTTSTPMETSKPLLKDAEAEDVDVHLYRSMIGSLMYLTSLRPDIMFVDKFSDFKTMLDYGYNFMNTKIFIDNESTICIVKNPVFHSKTKHIEIRHHFIRDSNEKKLIQASHSQPLLPHRLYKNSGLLLRQKLLIWKVQIQALVDGKKVIVTETSVRRALQLKDVEGTECLPNAAIFAKLERMSAKTTAWNEFSSTMPQLSSVLPQTKNSTFSKPITDEAANEEHVPIHSNDPLLSGEDRLKLNELMELCTNLSQRVLDLENTKTSQAAEITKLKERVKKLERRNKSRTPGLKRLRKVGRTARIESSEDEGLGAQEDASKQGRKIADLDADAEVTLVDEAQGRIDDNLMFDTGVFDEQEVEVEKVVSTAEVTTASATTTTVDELTLAQTLIEIKAAKPKAITTAATTTTTAVTRPKDRGVVVQEPIKFRTTTSYSQTSQLPQAKDKGKAKMIEPEKTLKKKDQILVDEEIAQRLQEELQAELEEEERLARQKEEEDNLISWDNTQAMMEADYELAQRLQADEQGELTIKERSKLFVELMDKRKKHFAKLRAKEIRRKPPTKS
ncbi:retrovirus-related pol polyprotein from transposon TNT 1-94, partial [Tanacetum coccineum]